MCNPDEVSARIVIIELLLLIIIIIIELALNIVMYTNLHSNIGLRFSTIRRRRACEGSGGHSTFLDQLRCTTAKND